MDLFKISFGSITDDDYVYKNGEYIIDENGNLRDADANLILKHDKLLHSDIQKILKYNKNFDKLGVDEYYELHYNIIKKKYLDNLKIEKIYQEKLTKLEELKNKKQQLEDSI